MTYESKISSIRKQEIPPEKVLLETLKECEPYILPGTADLHQKELLGLHKQGDLDIKNILKLLTEFSSLRTLIDCDETQNDEKKKEKLMKELKTKAIEINTLVDYGKGHLIPDPKIVRKFRDVTTSLMYHIPESGYADTIAKRMQGRLDRYIKNSLRRSYKYLDKALPPLTTKLHTIDILFPKNINYQGLDGSEKSLSFLPFIAAIEDFYNDINE